MIYCRPLQNSPASLPHTLFSPHLVTHKPAELSRSESEPSDADLVRQLHELRVTHCSGGTRSGEVFSRTSSYSAICIFSVTRFLQRY